MNSTLANHPKVTPEHQQRPAFVYVRQSTLMQVRHNTGSTARQYDLQRRAQELGWLAERIRVLDQDLGRSGASSLQRDGFQLLVAEVGLGHVGAVFCLEASRVARSCSDWYRLLELCALTNTLVIDEEGIYDPRHYNDRLLLGFKGAMSEAELHWLVQRMNGGKLMKAQQGELRQPLPVGFVYDPDGRVVFDPDEQVRHAVRLIFSLFEQLGSALAVVRRFTQQHLLFPKRRRSSAEPGELLWEPLQHSRVVDLLHNPFYAGTYVYGRTARSTTMSTVNQLPAHHMRRRKQEEWPIVLRDHHTGYIGWDRFLANVARLADNRTLPAAERRGAVREGNALLQGIVLCGKCGHRMQVYYQEHSSAPSYKCNRAHVCSGEPTCQTIRGDGIDQAVAQSFLAALTPAQVDLAIAAYEQVEQRHAQEQRQWQLQLERSQYEVDLARRRYMAVDPANRLVARSLEREWNAKMAELERLEQPFATRTVPMSNPLQPQERAWLLRLVADVPALWQAPTTSQVERKHLLRLLIKDVTLTRRAEVIGVAIRWQTDACTYLEVARPLLSSEQHQTDAAVITTIRELAVEHSDRELAAILNERGFRSGYGRQFSAALVNKLRRSYGIVTGRPERPSVMNMRQRSDGRYSVKALAELLKVDISTVSQWCRQGHLDCVRETPRGPYWIMLSAAELSSLARPVCRRRAKRTAEAWVTNSPQQTTEVQYER
jgi:DNA invertase Pin-like site-specific DNA recombinase